MIVFSVLCSILLTLTMFTGCVKDEPSSSFGLIQIPGLSASQMKDSDYKLASFYEETSLSINATSIKVSLPIKFY